MRHPIARSIRRLQTRLWGKRDQLTHKRVLVSWYNVPQYIPPFKLTDKQITVGPKLLPDQPLGPFDAFTPSHPFDLKSELRSLGLPTEYDAIVVASDASRKNQPLNLEAFDCPKVLAVGDTHHFESPIRKMAAYAKAGKFDLILLSFTRQHVHWFLEAGFKDVAWLPGIVPNVAMPFSEHRQQQVCFFGYSKRHHPRRNHLLSEIDRLKPFPFILRKGPHQAGANLYASSAVSLNCSLNGDFNLRVFETLAAGGCLLTDRLSPQAGLDLLLREGKHYLGYDSFEECIEQGRFLLEHQDTALAMARSGYELFHSRMRPEARACQLLDWIFSGRLDSLFRVRDFRRGRAGDPGWEDRVRLYESLQELHRTKPSPLVLFMDDIPDIHVFDALDLRHLRIARARTDQSAIPAQSTEITERCRTISHSELANTAWDCVVSSDGNIPQPFLQTPDAGSIDPSRLS